MLVIISAARPPKGGQAKEISITGHGQPEAPTSKLAPTPFLSEADSFLRHYGPLLTSPAGRLNGKHRR